jgi:hypothetical protein
VGFLENPPDYLTPHALLIFSSFSRYFSQNGNNRFLRAFIVHLFREGVELAEEAAFVLSLASKFTNPKSAWKPARVDKLHIQRQCICLSFWEMLPLFQKAMLFVVFIEQVRSSGRTCTCTLKLCFRVPLPADRLVTGPRMLVVLAGWTKLTYRTAVHTRGCVFQRCANLDLPRKVPVSFGRVGGVVHRRLHRGHC